MEQDRVTDKELARLCLETAQRLADVAARLTEPPPPAQLEDGPPMTCEELAQILDREPKAIYGLAKRADWKPYVVRIGKRGLGFKRGLLKHLQLQG